LQVGFWITVVQLCCSYQDVDCRRTLSPVSEPANK
jgi:hypothetical protein